MEPFLFELHAAMLRLLEPLFLEHIPRGGRVLDAGCGRSLFTEIRPDWPFAIVASDVDHDLLASRQAEFPNVRWLVGDAQPLPFRDGAFDALFAGELVEHLPDPRPALREFRAGAAARGHPDPHHPEPPAPGQPGRPLRAALQPRPPVAS